MFSRCYKCLNCGCGTYFIPTYLYSVDWFYIWHLGTFTHTVSEYCCGYFIFNSKLTHQQNHFLFNAFFSIKNIIKTQIHPYSKSVSQVRLITSQSWATKAWCIMTHPHKSHLMNNFWNSQLVMPNDELRLARSNCEELPLPFATVCLNSCYSSMPPMVTFCTGCQDPQTTG